MYTKIFTDMKVVILSMPSPTDPNKLLFEEITGTDASNEDLGQIDKTQIVKKPVPKISDYIVQKSSAADHSTKGGLADEVKANEDPDQEEETNYDAGAINNFWNKIHERINKLAEQGEVSSECRDAEAAMGLICLHTFKLISRSVSATFTSINARINNHFQAIFRPTEWDLTLVAPHSKALEALFHPMQSQSADVLPIVSILLTKLIFIYNGDNPAVSEKGLLYGSCLTHIGMHGLAPIKYLEQAAQAQGKSTADFAPMVLTRSTLSSVQTIIQFLTVMGNAPQTITILGQELKVAGQTTWRFCRLYNQSYFSRFKTSTNVRLILKCVAFLYASGRAPQIRNMMLLQNSLYDAYFQQDVAAVKQWLEREKLKGDEGLGDDAANIWSATTSSCPENPF